MLTENVFKEHFILITILSVFLIMLLLSLFSLFNNRSKNTITKITGSPAIIILFTLIYSLIFFFLMLEVEFIKTWCSSHMYLFSLKVSLPKLE